MGDRFPLIAHATPLAVVAYRRGLAVCAGQFLSQAVQLAARLPHGAPVLNVCSDRYLFAVGLAAALLARSRSLLPPTHTPEVIRYLRQVVPEAVCLTDDRQCAIDMPLVPIWEQPPGYAEFWPPPLIPADQDVADIFTSGSTGAPIPHRKTWGRISQCVLVEAERLGFKNTQVRTVLATVPPQHAYGLESSVLLPLLSGAAFCAEKPFYPADICAALAAAPEPRVLISTPIHLRALLAVQLPLPSVDFVLSATAPITQGFSLEVERRFGAPLLEIYGSTETGQIANRRPARSPEWRLWSGVRLIRRNDRIWAEGGHIEVPTPLGDNVEIVAPDLFLLGSRLQDVVNIAGKRNSIDYLNHQLLAIPGVRDGAFFLPEEASRSGTEVVRLSAVVVAPNLNVAALRRELRARIDPVFLPRPLLLVKSLPRTGTGKLPLQMLRSMLAEHLRGVTH